MTSNRKATCACRRKARLAADVRNAARAVFSSEADPSGFSDLVSCRPWGGVGYRSNLRRTVCGNQLNSDLSGLPLNSPARRYSNAASSTICTSTLPEALAMPRAFFRMRLTEIIRTSL